MQISKCSCLLSAFYIFVFFSSFAIYVRAENNYLPSLPDPEPYLKSKQLESIKPILKTFSPHNYYKDGTTPVFGVYKSGNKEVRIQTSPSDKEGISIYLIINDKEVGCVRFWGRNKHGFGYPYVGIKDNPAKFDFDTGKGIAKFTKAYLDDNNEKRFFLLAIRILENGKLELEYTKASPWLQMCNEYRDRKITFGDKVFYPNRLDDLITKGPIMTTHLTGNVSYCMDKPAESYSIEFGNQYGFNQERVSVNPKTKETSYFLSFHTNDKCQRPDNNKIYINLGKSLSEHDKTRPEVGGIDFWKLDAMHVPLPSTRNVMPNPSFEQGLRYWEWVTFRGSSYQPEDKDQCEIVEGGLFGHKALLYRKPKGCAMSKSLPIALDKGEKYTFSFYAKADTPGKLLVFMHSAAEGGNLSSWNPKSGVYRITDKWQRFTNTFTADGKGVFAVIAGMTADNVMLDGFQLEKGETASEFVCPPVEGKLETAMPDNDIVKGHPIQAAFILNGRPGTKGEVRLSARNAFREVLYSDTHRIEIGGDGTQKINIDFDEKKFGEGIFVVKAEYRIPGFNPYYDYYRFSIMTPLSNTHATKNLFSNSGPPFFRIWRGEDLARKYMEWGFGSITKITPIKKDSGYPEYPHYLDILGKNRITGLYWGPCAKFRLMARIHDWQKVSPEQEAQIEEEAYRIVKDAPEDVFQLFGFGNEEESTYLVRNRMFDEYCKLQYATYRGVKRANPKALVAPTSGPSGYSRLRGYDEMEGYLKAAQKRGFKYDAISLHPYGAVDKGWQSYADRDVENARLLEQIQRYGYGKETPVYHNEGGNLCQINVPMWDTKGGDAYRGGNPTYDIGNKEFIQAATYARQWIIDLKYWPQIRQSCIWTSHVIMDQHLTPLLLCKAVNTLGNNFGYVEFLRDIKPYSGIRGYAFKLKDGTGIVPIWCVDVDVEKGYRRGPGIKVKFDQDVTFIDLMGNQRFARPDKDGYTLIQLTPAPLLIKAKDADKLADSLLHCQLSDVRSALTVALKPDKDGNIVASLENQTSLPQNGKIIIAGEEIPYNISANNSQNFVVPKSNQGNNIDKIYSYEIDIAILSGHSDKFNKQWNMEYFYVPRSKGMPDWSKIKGIDITNIFNPVIIKKEKMDDGKIKTVGIKQEYNGKDDFSAVFKTAWDKDNFYLRVEVIDDKFVKFPVVWKTVSAYKSLYRQDGALEVYFDCGANGRSKSINSYDDDDYRFDFSVGKDYQNGRGMVFRLQQVDHQLAGGVNMPSQQEASEEIRCDFRFTEKGYSYTIVFGQRYIEPIMLRPGFVTGFCLYLHDRDNPEDNSAKTGLNLCTKDGEHPQKQPGYWPLMILSE